MIHFDTLRRWPDVFEIDETSVRLNASLADVNTRSAAMRPGATGVRNFASSTA